MVIRFGVFEANLQSEELRKHGLRLRVPGQPFKILAILLERPGQVVTREQILNQVWGYEESPTTRTIDNFVAKLRQKIERSPHEPEHILTVHGAGYKFVG